MGGSGIINNCVWIQPTQPHLPFSLLLLLHLHLPTLLFFNFVLRRWVCVGEAHVRHKWAAVFFQLHLFLLGPSLILSSRVTPHRYAVGPRSLATRHHHVSADLCAPRSPNTSRLLPRRLLMWTSSNRVSVGPALSLCRVCIALYCIIAGCLVSLICKIYIGAYDMMQFIA